MKSVKYISASPDELYYAWQVEVMLENFISVGIPSQDIQIVVGIQKHIGEWWHKLIQKYPLVGFYFYEDTRVDKNYPPSIRPHILAKHWHRFPDLISEVIFYHDCDIIFTRKPCLDKLIKGETWYVSDTRSYLGIDYINSKGSHILDGMTDAVHLNEDMVILNDKNAGGAQYIMKDMHELLWQQTETRSENLYLYLGSIDSDIQKWTADMWALLWTAWAFEIHVKIEPSLSFCMATDTWPKWDKNLIYHNAGAVDGHRGKLFLKQDFRGSLPYDDQTQYDSQFCSSKYHDHIIEVGKKSCLKPPQIDVQSMLDDCKSIFIGI